MSTIEVFADITCPFAHVGFRRVVAERTARSREDVQLHIRAWSLELVNGKPLEGAAVAGKVEALRASVAPDLFRGFDADSFPRTSTPALRVAHGAYAQSTAEGERVSLLLRTALFEDGRDIADRAVLRDLWPDADVWIDASDPGPEVADWTDGKARGVKGSPHFFIDKDDFYCPSMAISYPNGDLDIRFDDERFDKFLSQALRAS